MYDYLLNPANRLNNAVRKLEEISNHLTLLKGCNDLVEVEMVIKGLRQNIKWSKSYLQQYLSLTKSI